MRKAVALVLTVLALCACNSDSYTVIERTTPERDSEPWVKLVLKYNNHKLFVDCNNLKAAKGGKTTRCDLRVGQSVKCKPFLDRQEEGYDLICGSELTDGKLTTSGGNELLLLRKEELVEK